MNKIILLLSSTMFLRTFNLFFMQMYAAHEPQSLYDVEAFLYVQEGQLDNFMLEQNYSYPLGFDDNKVLKNNWYTDICSSVQDHKLKIQLRIGFVESICEEANSFIF